MKRSLFVFMAAGLLGASVYLAGRPRELATPHIPHPVFDIRSIDTMKYSRDLARSKRDDQSFGEVIHRQVAAIAETGATHVAIATPYDEEFIPFLTQWVAAARAEGLHVWFRGNFAGWEGWFEYPKISRSEHREKLESFISGHSTLFENGDILTPCPECENGGSGDPRNTGDVEGFRTFLVEERDTAQKAFAGIGKKVSVDVQSMNYDVASLIMDQATTAALGGVVGIDHYVEDPVQVSRDVTALAEKSGGKVFLGEYGAPIPDIHGKMSEEEQAEWIRISLEELSYNKHLVGINYWVAVGGSTEIWKTDGTPRRAVDIIKHYYTMLR